MLFVITFFWLMLIFYSVLTLAGVAQRLTKRKKIKLSHYPSVAILIPAYNEGVVIKDTVQAMLKLDYPGELKIYVLDDNSKDDTAEIVEDFSRLFSKVCYVSVPPGKPTGKSRVLNYGLSITKSDYFLVYDADNQPNSDAVIELVHAAETTENAAGAVGYVRTVNENTNLLTQMISIEFKVFQLLMQSGRWKLFETGSLAGTNMLLKREVLEQVGGYDPYALAEDAELTIRISAIGKKLPVVHQSQTWEQEPESMKIFIKQRTRWLIGNLYLLEKSFFHSSFWKGKTFIYSLQHVLTYLVFVILLSISNIWLIGGLFGMTVPYFDIPLLFIWFLSYVVFTIQVLSAVALEETITFHTVFVSLIMYFTYAQLFLLLLLKSFGQYFKSKIKNETITWDKTKRFKKDKKP